MNTLICHNCNKRVDRNSKFCVYCGNKIQYKSFCSNKNGYSYKKNNQVKEQNLCKKMVLGSKGKDMLIFKIIVYPIIIFLFIVFILLNTFLLNSFLPELHILVAFDIFIISMILLLVAPMFLFAKPKIVIENSTITKYGVFNIKRKLGHISEITSFSEVTAHINVLRDDKLLFTFNKHGRDDNDIFYNYLKNNYNKTIFVNANQILPFVFIMFGFLLIWIPPLALLLIIYGLNEKYKSFQIYNDKVIFKSLFSNRIINLCNLTKIEYASDKYYSDGRRRRYYSNGRGSIGPIFETFIIAGFDSSSRRCFKADKLTAENLEFLKQIIKKYEIELIQNDYLY